MAGEVVQPDLPLAQAPVAPAPAAAAPVEAALSSAAPAVEATPQTAIPASETAAPAAEAPKPADVKAEPAKAPEAPKSLLGDDAAPVEPAKVEEAPAEPKPLPVYEKFALPEGFQAEEKALGEFTKHLGEFELDAGADHAKVASLGQKLVDFYVADKKQTADAQQEAWRATNEQWQNVFIADKEIGGNRRETTLQTAKSMIAQYGGTKDQQKELKGILGLTGAGNHPAVIRLLNNIGKVLGEGKPVPAVVPKAPVPDRKSARRYNGATMNGA